MHAFWFARRLHPAGAGSLCSAERASGSRQLWRVTTSVVFYAFTPVTLRGLFLHLVSSRWTLLLAWLPRQTPLLVKVLIVVVFGTPPTTTLPAYRHRTPFRGHSYRYGPRRLS